ncbi:MAG: bifunctional glutamate N-acetyltransferase/amino-acid acetyltransferase ArgJ [Bifidobacteriaceae bacterium]|jgi:glutamate N-acetyltransferase/amino-acid N-acetyltransferase|nr:bifunctional glutamate N-acetyltransferase/amino-acid acetyltransferase ArgJ [Bifidobacteriaceae bacterium]
MTVTAPKGFRAAGVAAGIKADGAKDLAVVVNDAVAARSAAAAVFTVNRFAAAPVLVSREAMALAKGGYSLPRAILLNSGGANACTGRAGLDDARQSAGALARRLALKQEEALVCSTGLIGERLPIGKLLAGMHRAVVTLSDGEAAGRAAAEAIMTTDTRPKTALAGGADGAYKIGGMAKGAGMLAPELATMLAVVTTDALIDSPTAQRALEEACRLSFERVDSDGCMSTNDTVILLASGESGHQPDPAEFAAALTGLAEDLARQLIADAEGAHHEIAVKVTGGLTEDGALKVARGIARSNLFKTAIAGADPNWGRILSAAGAVSPQDAPFEADRVDVSVNGVTICRGGAAGERRELVDLSGRQVEVVVDLGAGSAQATVLTNDLTHEYVSINADYPS